MEELVEGWTGDVTQQLLLKGAALPATGFPAPELILHDRLGKAVSTAGKTSWENAAQGIAKYTPGATDLKASLSPYEARWKVTDAGGKITFYPNADPDRWLVRSP